MNLTNYHCHSLFCDGRADMESFVRFAVTKGFSSFGFSSHAPLPFPTNWTMEWDRMDDYLHEFERLKTKYKDRIELIIGLEIDYIDDTYNPSYPRFHRLPLDFRIGSVHLLPDMNGKLVDSDCPATKFCTMVDEHFDGDIERVVKLYYQRSKRMIELGGFDIVGHADKIHYNASCYRPGLKDEPWYDLLVKDYLEEIAQYGYQVEINSKSYPTLNTFYPDERYFEMMHSLGIKVQVNSDSHYPDRINNGRQEALVALKKAGYKEVMEWHNGVWTEQEIDIS